MIKLVHDNILVTEVVKDSKAGVLTVSQDESSAYMFVKIIEISEEANSELYDKNGMKPLDKENQYLVIRRTAKDPFIQDKFFISYKDVRAIIDKEYFEEI